MAGLHDTIVVVLLPDYCTSDTCCADIRGISENLLRTANLPFLGFGHRWRWSCLSLSSEIWGRLSVSAMTAAPKATWADHNAGKVFPFEQFKEAIRESLKAGRGAKVRALTLLGT